MIMYVFLWRFSVRSCAAVTATRREVATETQIQSSTDLENNENIH